MDEKAKKQVDTLNDLIQICNDGACGYEEAAEDISNKEIKTIFNRLSQQRRGFAEELKNEVNSLGGEPTSRRNVEGFLHNNWLKVKSLIASNDDEMVIKTCKTGEEYAVEQYSKHISESSIPSYLRDKIVKQHDMIKGACEQLEGFQKEITA
jgi:uncharacterized protein (TIGR02284 family)